MESKKTYMEPEMEITVFENADKADTALGNSGNDTMR